jgi:hypothetical protein
VRTLGTAHVLLALLAAIAPAAFGSGGAGAALSGREAARAVREEIGNSWISLATYPARVRTPGASTRIECTEMSAAKRVCDWSASNSGRRQFADGVAVVSARPGGAVARLYASFCRGPEGLACY